MFRNAALLLAVLGATCSTQALAAQGTPQEQAACRHDVARWCRGAHGDDAVLVCLQSHRGRLSNACRSVLESNGR